MPNLIDARFLESVTPLGGAGTFNGPWRDRSALGAHRFRAFAASDQAGTLNIQQSDDQVSVSTPDTVAIVANTPVTLESSAKLVQRFVRVQLVNGATPQTSLRLQSELLEQ